MPDRCPSCNGGLVVRTLACPECETRVEGRFGPCRFCGLERESFELLDLFLRSRGNVKDVQRELGLSYPTVRSKLEQLWVRLGYRTDPEAPAPISAEEIVGSLRDGDLSVDEAVEQLRTRRESG